MVKLYGDILTALFAPEVCGSEERAIFIKGLIDFMHTMLAVTVNQGLDQESLPIAVFSVWQDIRVGSGYTFKLNERIEKNNLQLLITNMREAVRKWG